MNITDIFFYVVLFRMALVIGVIACFLLMRSEHGVRLWRGVWAFLLYFADTLVSQVLQVLGQATLALWWLAITGTLALAVLVVALFLDLRKHYRENGGSHKQD